MMTDNGYNPMDGKQGSKIKQFAESLPKQITLKNLDGIIGVNGNFLILKLKEQEWIPMELQIFYQRLTRTSPVFVMVIEADVESMTVYGVNYIVNGEVEPQIAANLQELQEAVGVWSAWAEKHPVIKIK
jgi:hypothetical protein